MSIIESNLEIDRDDAEVGEIPSEDDSWERFMILWGVTPEIFVGSCLLSLVIIIVTCIVTGRTRKEDHCHNQKSVLKHRDEAENPPCSNKAISYRRIIDVPESSSMSQERGNVDERSMRTLLAKHQNHKDAVADMSCKKNLFKLVSDKMQSSLTDEQINEENEIKRKQLEAIYNLMKNEGELFGIHNINQIEEQMKLYG